MPKIVQINSFSAGSTGKIARAINQEARNYGWDTYFFYGREWHSNKKINDGKRLFNLYDTYLHILFARIFDSCGLHSHCSTRKLIRKIEEIKPDIIHLHNIHGYYLNFPMLFEYLSHKDIPVVWTLHDCWSLTGHCAYFDRAGCNKWKTHCHNCPQRKTYPVSYVFDGSSRNYNCKKQSFALLNNLTMIPVSSWLEDLVHQSFMKNTKTCVIHNGIDADVFTPKKINNKQEKPYIIGVASPWSERKGLKDFVQLRRLLDKGIDIKLVGLSKEQMAGIPASVIGLEHTNSLDEMVELYSNALAYVNLTYEDNFPTTNIEALSCGTPVITYNTGGSPEAVDDETGFVVDQGNLKGVVDAVNAIIVKGRENYTGACRSRAMEKFNARLQHHKYIELYNRILSENE